MKLPQIEQEAEPKGKRSYRWNVWGNYVGYIGRKRWMTFALESDAIDWVNEDKENKKDTVDTINKTYRTTLSDEGIEKMKHIAVIKCEFDSIFAEYGNNDLRLRCKVNHQFTITSKLKLVDFERKLAITQNNIYSWE